MSNPRRELAEAIDDLLDTLYVPIIKDPNQPGEGRRNPIEARLGDILVRIWGQQYRRALGALQSLFEGVEGIISAGEFRMAAGLLRRIMGPDFAAMTAEQVGRLVGMGYMAGRRSTARQLRITPNLSLVDRRSQAVLSEHTVYWVGQHYDDALRSTIEKTVKELGFGLGFGREDIGQALRDALAPIARSDVYWRGLAAVVLTRSRAIGAVQSFVDGGWETYEILAVMDERTSDICREMNGRIFKVAEAVSLRDAMLNAETPDDVKAIAPWVKVRTVQGQTTGDLPRGLSFPPYHFFCRTQVIANVEEVGDGRTTEAVIETPAEASPTVRSRLGVLTPQELATKVRSLRGVGWDKGPASTHLGQPEPTTRQVITINQQARDLMRDPDAVYAFSTSEGLQWAFVKGGKIVTLSDDNWTFLSMGDRPLSTPANWTRIILRGG